MKLSGRRLAALLVIVVSLVVVGAAPALADPATPTNYRSEVVGVEGPGVDHVEIVGGDAFVRLSAAAGMTVVVLGYEGEDYIRFLPNGQVSVNQLSPATYLNDDRYANVELPGAADARAEPRWEVVSVDGTYSWHDHRTHWMSPALPATVLESGEDTTVPIFDWVLPLTIDGEPGSIVGTLTWIPSGGRAQWFAVALLALLAIAVISFLLRARSQAGVLFVLATLAFVAGLAAIASQPPEGRAYGIELVGPPIVIGLAVFAAIQVRTSPSAAERVVFIGSVALSAWGILRAEVLTRPILPTLLPYAVDRTITAVVVGGAVGLAAGVGAAITWRNRMHRVRNDAPPAI
jgi:hypothetical protein